MENTKLLSGNILKIIGCIAMLIDHLGAIIFPEVLVLRIIGRIAYPIFAFMLVEGCIYTRNRLKHLLLIFGMAIFIQVGYSLFMHDYSFSIFAVFSISIILIYIYDYLVKLSEDIKSTGDNKNKKILLFILLLLIALIIITSVIILDIKTTLLLAGYGFQGALIPVILYIVKKACNNNYITLGVFIVLIVGSALMRKELYNLFSLCAILLLLLYNDKKGKYNIKYFFYLFYPLHIIIIYLIYLLINS